MEWYEFLITTVGLGILLAPLAVLVMTIFVLVPLAHLLPRPAMLGRARFTCPVTRRTVKATFVSKPGSEHATDVTSCSLFGDGEVTCKKACLADTTSGWAPSAMTPRFALISDDVALRDTSAAAAHADEDRNANVAAPARV